ncbi:gluconolaconase [Pontibacter harenae]|uniref:gluconolaconase n=1 Tax=Pontibacter harenae TaxID=2894083 RepID=UPI001E3E5337|nr:gluconolaconase [Pontibacter harenae]MCC9165509.1 gluconolaconase [Pontibacter harenae]
MKKLLLHVFIASLLLTFASCSGSRSSRAPVTLTEAWSTDNTLRTPESTVYDENRDILYVSNINKVSENRKDGDGFISRVSTSGEVEELYWVSGLNDPKGIALYNNVLYVADVDEVVAISTQSGSILGRYSAENAGMLNDIAIDNNGTVFISDSKNKHIYQLRNGRVSMWVENTNNERPNGLYLEGNRMVVAFSSNGDVQLLDPETRRFTSFTNGVGAGDGIAATGDGNYFVSNWNGEIFYINSEARQWKVLDTKDQKKNTADITYSPRLGLLLVPTFFDNRLVAYRINY